METEFCSVAPTDWNVKSIEEVCARVTSGGTPSRRKSSYYVDGIWPWVKTQELQDKWIDDTEEHITEAAVSASSAKVLPVNTVLVAMYGATAGQLGLLRQPMTCNQASSALVVDPKAADFRFVFYQLLQARPQLKSLATGAAQQNLSGVLIKSLRFPYPPLPEQRAIAHILGTLDDKIELNRRMNETLEAMVRALFKSWFVDFDPVRAKAEGRDTGLPKHIADLFPGSFEDSELGEIPSGWTVGKLSNVLSQRVERCTASAETAARPYVPIDCISAKSLFLRESRPGEEAQSSLTKFYKGDLLFGAMRPYFHKICIAPFDGTTRTTAFVLYPRQPDDFAFVTLLLRHPDTIDFATRHSTGSTIPYAVWTGSLEEMPVVMPPLEIRKAFNGIAHPILLRIPEPYFENRTLAVLRDSLLPKLISGKLQVVLTNSGDNQGSKAHA